jgi:hypothetical protein
MSGDGSPPSGSRPTTLNLSLGAFLSCEDCDGKDYPQGPRRWWPDAHLTECGFWWLWMQVGFSRSLAAVPLVQYPLSNAMDRRSSLLQPVPSVEAPPRNAGEV